MIIDRAQQYGAFLVFAPGILLADLLLFLGCEVVCDVERTPDFFRRFSLKISIIVFEYLIPKCKFETIPG
jgi:hypothetical protein